MKKNLQIFIISGILNAVCLNLYNPFVVKYLQRLGGNEFHISLLNSLPGLMGIFFSLPGAIYMISRNKRSMKGHTMIFTSFSRILILFFVPLVYLSPQLAPVILVFLIGLKSLPESISQTALQGFIGDLVNEKERSTAISLKNKLSTPVTIIVSLLAGIIMRVLPRSDMERMHYYQIFFIVAAMFGILEVISFLKIKEPLNNIGNEKINIIAIIKDILKHKPFMSYTRKSLLFYFGWQMGWPLFSIYQVVYLGADELWLSIMFIGMNIGSFVGYSFWNKKIQTKGNALVASITTLGMAFNPILLAISPNLYWASALNFISGFFTAGNVTVLLNALLESTPRENRVVYIGTYNTLINISLMLSPIFAHFVLNKTGIFWALIIVSIIRMLGSIVFFNNRDGSFD